ncbi:P-loop containing nucleoside triphosphate hydrolase protein [Anaeromyces robustus]|uniref:p-loop containing nucleoside triphosphate hydrolase protein n=1 Tax=Anaeromyces robustus TaxID=1754192 RepID=A0A1Y1WU69_9FUNG|nr:P-loop containing nucleoside triphosphate hydrolase protein [Anaeromyces robustus]|eukprot:ORX77091.1 P-loop containing nucleoside triphosphate hydrolase protein [Anaeromyces robustus]
MENKNNEEYAIEVNNLNFGYGDKNILENVTLKLKPGSRCLLVGANGIGKSTLLRILAGKRLTKNNVKVLGEDPFNSVNSQDITYLGTEWATNPIVRRDILVSDLIKTTNKDKYPERCEKLLRVIKVNLNWRLHNVSDGERRRVQIVLGLINPFKVLLLDEVTVDLDVLVRSSLIQFLKEESETRNVTIVYATHIFDGIGDWPTHIAHLAEKHIKDFYTIEEVMNLPEIKNEKIHIFNSLLLTIVEKWLREDYQNQLKMKNDNEKESLTNWDKLADMKQYGDKYYNYWYNIYDEHPKSDARIN